MVIADGNGLPLSLFVSSASRAEITLLESTIAHRFLKCKLRRLIGDAAYDSDKHDKRLRRAGIELIAPNRPNRINFSQDRRKLRRYKRRWLIERLNAWLQNFRRIVVRYERSSQNFLAFLQFAAAAILARQLQ